MGEQHLLSSGPLLNKSGNLEEAGYAFSLVKRYDREAIKASKNRIKEWDYYYVGNASYGIALTIADNGYMGMLSVSILDFVKKNDITVSKITLFPRGKMKLPRTSRQGDTVYENKKAGIEMRFLHQEGKRRLVCRFENFGKTKLPFHCDIFLQETNKNSMVIATPFDAPRHFYYNQKINNLLATGYAKLGETMYDFSHDSYGVLDWGRGVWTYKNTWYWSSLNAKQDGRYIGFNLGYGFGNTSRASENMLFIDDKAIKLDDVKMDIPFNAKGGEDFLSPWKFRSSKGDIDLTFTPVYDRHADMNLLVLRSNQHQVFGIFEGVFRLEDEVIEIRGLPGFAEKVFNKW